MGYDTYKKMMIEAPEDIAAAMIERIKFLCGEGWIDEDYSDGSDEVIRPALCDALADIAAYAANPLNNDNWRTLYKVLSDLTTHVNRR